MLDWLIFLSSLALIFIGARFFVSPIAKRLMSLLVVVLGATLVVTLSLRLTPGDPVAHILGEQAQTASRELLAKELGLLDEGGQPLSFVSQYAYFVKSLATGQIKSYVTRRSTLDMVFERLPYTFMLAISAMFLAVILGPLFGVLASLFQNRLPDRLLSIFALVGISVPSFFLGPLLILFFAISLHLLPVSGADDGIFSLVLPACSMGFALAAMLSRMSRASMLEVLSEDYIRTAHAKGLSPLKVFFKHALKNALIPVVTVVGLQFGAVMAGTVVTEKVFNWPGIGLLLLEAIRQLDMPLVQTCVIVIAIMYAVVNMLTDIAYGLIDPRINLSGGQR